MLFIDLRLCVCVCVCVCVHVSPAIVSFDALLPDGDNNKQNLNSERIGNGNIGFGFSREVITHLPALH
jgi:hypothetical protein